MRQRGYVYYVQAQRAKLIKIGFTTDPKCRIRDLQNQNADRLTLLAVHPGTLEDERGEHEMFARLRVHGEWFKPRKRLLEYIAFIREHGDQTIRPIRNLAAMPVAQDIFTGRPLHEVSL